MRLPAGAEQLDAARVEADVVADDRCCSGRSRGAMPGSPMALATLADQLVAVRVQDDDAGLALGEVLPSMRLPLEPRWTRTLASPLRADLVVDTRVGRWRPRGRWPSSLDPVIAVALDAVAARARHAACRSPALPPTMLSSTSGVLGAVRAGRCRRRCWRPCCCGRCCRRAVVGVGQLDAGKLVELEPAPTTRC